MISLEKIQTGDQKFQFKCEHCDQIFNDWNLNISIFLYGVFFLSGSERGVIGITCPKCLKNIAIEGPMKEVCRVGANFLSGFQNGYQRAINQLAFFSSVNYHKNHTIDPNLNFCHYASFIILREDHSVPITYYLEKEYNQNPWLETDGFLISLLEDQYHSFGNPITVGWFKSDSIEKVIDIENANAIKLIDRYYYTNPILTEIDMFCWNFKYFDEWYGKIFEHEPSIYFEISKPSPTTILDDFLEIIFSDHLPFNFPIDLNIQLDGVWKTIHPFKAVGMPLSIHHLAKRQVDKSEETTKLIQAGQAVKATFPLDARNEFLRQKAFQFIEEYETAFKRPDFSYAHLWDLKLRYADKLLDDSQKRTTILAAPDEKINSTTSDTSSRHSSKVKLMCREVAKKLWDADAEITIADMCVCDEISEVAKQKSGELYKEGTIAKWIKDLCPNRQPGRRPKKD